MENVLVTCNRKFPSCILRLFLLVHDHPYGYEFDLQDNEHPRKTISIWKVVHRGNSNSEMAFCSPVSATILELLSGRTHPGLSCKWWMANPNEACHPGFLLDICINCWRTGFLKLHHKQPFYHWSIKKTFERKASLVLDDNLWGMSQWNTRTRWTFARKHDLHTKICVIFTFQKIIVAVVITGAFRSEIEMVRDFIGVFTTNRIFISGVKRKFTRWSRSLVKYSLTHEEKFHIAVQPYYIASIFMFRMLFPCSMFSL